MFFYFKSNLNSFNVVTSSNYRALGNENIYLFDLLLDFT